MLLFGLLQVGIMAHFTNVGRCLNSSFSLKSKLSITADSLWLVNEEVLKWVRADESELERTSGSEWEYVVKRVQKLERWSIPLLVCLFVCLTDPGLTRSFFVLSFFLNQGFIDNLFYTWFCQFLTRFSIPEEHCELWRWSWMVIMTLSALASVLCYVGATCGCVGLCATTPSSRVGTLAPSLSFLLI